MLAMGRAPMLSPEMLLLDEPSMGLARKLVEEVFAIIARMKALRISMLLLEQFAATALEVADFGWKTATACLRPCCRAEERPSGARGVSGTGTLG
jgi:energy-coupling factor transporter ATP-binding protein EcfA2